MTDIARAILRTVAYFDVLEYPLTSLEVWRWLQGPGTLGEVAAALAGDENVGSRLASQDGFWYVRGRAGVVAERLRRARIAERKLKRAQRFVPLLAAVPGVRMIALANTLALAASRDDADIDLFVIVAPGGLWTARAGLVTLLVAARARPGERARDPLCPSFFISEDALDLSALRIPDDIYLAYWIATLFPVTGGEGVYRRLWDANAWVREVLPNAWPRFNALEHGSRASKALTFLERPLRRFQEKRFPVAIRELMNRDTRVVVSDSVLKFHTNDRRAEIRDRWKATCAQLGA